MAMSTTSDLVTTLKAELKAAGLTYAGLAERLGMAESSVKRMFSAAGDMPLSRVDQICRVLRLDFADLAHRVAEREPLLTVPAATAKHAVACHVHILGSGHSEAGRMTPDAPQTAPESRAS